MARQDGLRGEQCDRRYLILPPGRRPYRQPAKTFAVLAVERQRLAMIAAHWLLKLEQPDREVAHQLLARVDELGRSLDEAASLEEAQAKAGAD